MCDGGDNDGDSIESSGDGRKGGIIKSSDVGRGSNDHCETVAIMLMVSIAVVMVVIVEVVLSSDTNGRQPLRDFLSNTSTHAH